MIDPDTREWLAGRRPAPAHTPPVQVPPGREAEAMRAALQTLHDDLYRVLCAFGGRELHIGGYSVREARIDTEEIYAMHDRLSDIRRTLGLEGR